MKDFKNGEILQGFSTKKYNGNIDFWTFKKLSVDRVPVKVNFLFYEFSLEF